MMVYYFRRKKEKKDGGHWEIIVGKYIFDGVVKFRWQVAIGESNITCSELTR